MASAYAHQVLKVTVAQLCETIGWNSIQSTPLELLTDILHKYLQEVTQQIHRYSELYGRSDPNLDDVALSFSALNINLADLEEYISNVDSVPCAIDVPKFPFTKGDNLNFLKHGTKEVITRPVHVHEYLPPMYPEKEETEPLITIVDDNQNEPSNTENAAILPDENDFFKKPDLLFDSKRTKPIERETRVTREITSVIMTTSGFLSPAREGKLPDAKTPKSPSPEKEKPPPIPQKESTADNSPAGNTSSSQTHSLTNQNNTIVVGKDGTDSGTGNGGLSAIKNTPIDAVKLDKKPKRKMPPNSGKEKERKKVKNTKLKSTMGPPPPKQMPAFPAQIFPPSNSPMATVVEQHHTKKTPTTIPSVPVAVVNPKPEKKRKKQKDPNKMVTKPNDGKVSKKRPKVSQRSKLSNLMTMGIGNVNAQLLAMQDEIEVKPEKIPFVGAAGQHHGLSQLVTDDVISLSGSHHLSSSIEPGHHYRPSQPPVPPQSLTFKGKLQSEPDKHKLNIFKRISKKSDETQRHHGFPTNLIPTETSIFPIMDDLKPVLSPPIGNKKSTKKETNRSRHLPEDLSMQSLSRTTAPTTATIDLDSVEPWDLCSSVSQALTPAIPRQKMYAKPAQRKTVKEPKEKKEKKERKPKAVKGKDKKSKDWQNFMAAAAIAAVGDGQRSTGAAQSTTTVTTASTAQIKTEHLPPTLGSYDPSSKFPGAQGFPMYPWPFPGLIPNNPLFNPFGMNSAPFSGPGVLPYGLPPFDMRSFPRLRRPILDIEPPPLPDKLPPNEKVHCNVAPLVPESIKLDDLVNYPASLPLPLGGIKTESSTSKVEKLSAVPQSNSDQSKSTVPVFDPSIEIHSSNSGGSIGLDSSLRDEIRPICPPPQLTSTLLSETNINSASSTESSVAPQQQLTTTTTTATTTTGKIKQKSDKRKDKEHKKEKRDKIKKKKDKKDKAKNKEKNEKKREEKHRIKEMKEKAKKVKREKKKEKERLAAAAAAVTPTVTGGSETGTPSLSSISPSSFGAPDVTSDSGGGAGGSGDVCSGGTANLTGTGAGIDNDRNEGTTIPKLTLKLGTSMSPRSTSPADSHKKITVKSRKDENAEKDVDSIQHYDAASGRESPELARISALVTRPPKPKIPSSTSIGAGVGGGCGSNGSSGETGPISGGASSSTATMTAGQNATGSIAISTTGPSCSASSLLVKNLQQRKMNPPIVCDVKEPVVSRAGGNLTSHPTTSTATTKKSGHSEKTACGAGGSGGTTVASLVPGGGSGNDSNTTGVQDSEGNQVWICPACGRVDDGTPMIGCDGCDAWYHWVCVGIQVPPDDNEDWYCRVCIAKKQEWQGSDKKKKRKKKDKKDY